MKRIGGLGIKSNVIEVTPDQLDSRELLELTHRTATFDVIECNSAWIGDYEPYILPLDEYVANDKDAIVIAGILPVFSKAQKARHGGTQDFLSSTKSTIVVVSYKHVAALGRNSACSAS